MPVWESSAQQSVSTGWTHGNNSICGQGQWQRTCVWGAYCTGARKQLLFVLFSAGSAVS